MTQVQEPLDGRQVDCVKLTGPGVNYHASPVKLTVVKLTALGGRQLDQRQVVASSQVDCDNRVKRGAYTRSSGTARPRLRLHPVPPPHERVSDPARPSLGGPVISQHLCHIMFAVPSKLAARIGFLPASTGGTARVVA